MRDLSAAGRRMVAAQRLRLDAWRFQSERANYYEYLADLIQGLDGRKTLRDLFDDDAHRYGARTVRGRLSAHWSNAYQDSGGDLAAAWAGVLPDSECLLVAAAQAAGGGALAAALRDLAQAASLLEQARSVLIGTTLAGLLAILSALLLLCSVPFYTVPRLQQVFQALPPDYYGPLTRNLFGLAQGLRQGLPFWLILLAGGAWLLVWSLPNLTGAVRLRLDRWMVWRLYRDFHAIRFLAMLAILIRRRGNIDTRLRQALTAQEWGAKPWMAWHIAQMQARVDAGVSGADTFDTGLLDRETWWFMADMTAAQGLEAGLARARMRAESHTLLRVRRQALVLRWSLLLGAVGMVLGLALWHYGAIDELRRGLLNFYASR